MTPKKQSQLSSGTPCSVTAGRAMHLILIILLLQSCTTQKPHFTQEQEIQLSTPIPQYQSTLFEDTISLSFRNTYPNSKICFTTDGAIPTHKSLQYTKPISFTETTHVKALTFHPHIQPSEMVEIDFLQVKKPEPIREIQILQKPSENYPGQGVQSLFDLQKGSLNFRENVWMGFDKKEVEITISFTQPQKLNEVILSTMQDHGSWIFLPEKIEVISQSDTVFFQWEIPTAAEAKRLTYLHVDLGEIESQSLRIRIKSAEKIPDWHPGAGHKPWLFVDEVIIR